MRRRFFLSVLMMTPGAVLAQPKVEPMSDNAQIIRDFISAWSRLNADELAAYFTEDGVYHNMPSRPVSGRSGRSSRGSSSPGPPRGGKSSVSPPTAIRSSPSDWIAPGLATRRLICPAAGSFSCKAARSRYGGIISICRPIPRPLPGRFSRRSALPRPGDAKGRQRGVSPGLVLGSNAAVGRAGARAGLAGAVGAVLALGGCASRLAGRRRCGRFGSRLRRCGGDDRRRRRLYR